MSYDHIWHIAELVPLLLACWRMFTAANKILTVFKAFPPHLHVNGNVVYPEGFEPGKIARLNIQQ